MGVRTKPRLRKIRLRKAERSYTRSISLREDQIKKLEDAGIKNMSELFQKLVDDWLLARDKQELARLRERSELLGYKYNTLIQPRGKTESEEQAKARWAKARFILEEIVSLGEKADEIEENIGEPEEE
jgi:hypothetical protein